MNFLNMVAGDCQTDQYTWVEAVSCSSSQPLYASQKPHYSSLQLLPLWIWVCFLKIAYSSWSWINLWFFSQSCFSFIWLLSSLCEPLEWNSSIFLLQEGSKIQNANALQSILLTVPFFSGRYAGSQLMDKCNTLSLCHLMDNVLERFKKIFMLFRFIWLCLRF
jgi:hypothetical protein